jgi:hypothetical protein
LSATDATIALDENARPRRVCDRRMCNLQAIWRLTETHGISALSHSVDAL